MEFVKFSNVNTAFWVVIFFATAFVLTEITEAQHNAFKVNATRTRRAAKGSAWFGGSSQTLCEPTGSPKGGGMSCSATSRKMTCTATCLTGFAFPDGSHIKKHVCNNYDGTWLPDMRFPDCEPICDPPCSNGGRCYGHNKCVCTQDFRGEKCDFPVSNCDGNQLGVIGSWACNHTMSETTCVIACAPGMQFEYPPASIYVCDLQGNWLPKYVPKCNPMQGGSYVDVVQMPTSESLVIKPIETKVLSAADRWGSCSTWGQLHYRTFDGSMFSVQGRCTYLLARDVLANTFSIQVRNDPYCNGVRDCRRSVIIYTGDSKYTLENTVRGGPALYWGENMVRIPSTINGLLVEKVADYILVKSSLGFAIKWNGQDAIGVEVSRELYNNTAGLCGCFDGKQSTDLAQMDGTITTNPASLANSWKMNGLDEPCQDANKMEHTCKYDNAGNQQLSDKADETCGRVMNKDYAKCHELVDPKPYFEMCRLDYCSCKEDGASCMCSSLVAYFQECHRLGGAIDGGWRKKDFCHVDCPATMAYQDCGSSCPKTCKRNLQDCSSEQCVDGCQCPPGTVLHNSSCVREDECPCYHSGKPYASGESINQDCNTCKCDSGLWQCTDAKCQARCSSVGDPHYTTFDGKHYNFMGKCSYYLMHDKDYSIEQENVACSGAISEAMGFAVNPTSDFPSCTKSVTIRYKGNVVRLKQKRQIVINSKEIVELPASVVGVHVYAASSLYLKAELDNGLSVTWDGMSRVYVDAPVGFSSVGTRGLCGTFNYNQKDDFLTSEGDIEIDTTAFANKWKTADACEDQAEASDKRIEDPCQLFPSKRQTAQLTCGKLKSDIFSACHETIDPESFYKDCMYDVCYCQTKLENCLCPALANYAMKCTKMSVSVDWRPHVGECGISCPAGQTYQVCSNPCQRSCTDIAYHSSCRASDCLEGCNCPPGSTLGGDGECIPLSDCPCVHAGKSYPAGRMRMRGNETCQCSSALWVCREATEVELTSSLTAASEEERTGCSSAANQEYTDCASECPLTCRNMHVPPKCDTGATCQPGCKCKKGYVMDTKSSHCVKPTECPCHHGGQSYGEGDMIQEECNTCVCEGGLWKCEKRECSGTCSVWGESHFRTFDGRSYEFHGDCDYLMARGASDDDGKFLVTIRNVPCGTSDVTCARAVTLQIGDEKVILSSEKPFPKDVYGSRYVVRPVGLFVFVHTDIGITLQWDKGTRIYIRADVKWKNKLDGLCGNYNDNENDDMRTSEGGPPVARPTVFGDSWRMHSHCPVSKLVNDTCELHPHRKSWAGRQCGALKSALFRPCHTEVPFEPYLDRCIADACGCDTGGDCECVCTALAAYGQECAARGVTLKWRSQELCPIQCPTCAEYSSCMSVCPARTCKTQYLYAGVEETCSREACVEGCQPKACEDGQLYDDDRHFKCIPDDHCVQPPCRLVNGRMYHEGERIRDNSIADVCQSCYCRTGDIFCVGKKCIKDLIEELPAKANISEETTTTTEATMEAASCQADGWTEWMNGFNPTFKNGGDYETLDLLRRRRFTFCPLANMRHIECRTAATHKHYKETGQNVWCSLPEGLLCENKDQTSLKLCYDYEVRVFCQCSPEVVVTEAPETTTTIATTTEQPLPVVRCNVPGWTEWMNSSVPDASGDEREILPELRRRYSFCSDSEIERVECSPASSDVVSGFGSDAGDVECTRDRGLVCRHRSDKPCADHRVRFFCRCDESGCDYPRGMESGAISDQQISVSSFRTPATLGHKSRLKGAAAWSAGILNQNQWIEIDLGEIQEVSGIVTQGNPNHDEWVSAYKLAYSNDGQAWLEIQTAQGYEQIFAANNDRNTVVTNMINPPIEARYIRLTPIEWDKWISLRMEILGCSRFVSTTTTTTTSSTTMRATLTSTVAETTVPVTTTPPETTLPATTTPIITTTIRGTPFPYECVQNAWTKWMNIDSPTITRDFEINEKISGDIESSEELRYFYAFCAQPTTVECRVTGTHQMSHLTGQHVRCDLDGLHCRNDQQEHGECLDYEIRFYCQCQEETTIPAPTTNAARTNPPEAPPVTECKAEEHGWTEWMNSGNPAGQRDGDMETYSDLRAKFSFCADRFVTDIECRVAESHEYFHDAGQYGVVCDANRGLQCLHAMQPGGGWCKDYEVRFYCMCTTVVTHIIMPTAATNYSSQEHSIVPTVNSSFINTGPIDVICNAWTSWINSDSPLDDGTDRELLYAIPRFSEFCPKQAAHQCRDAATKENYLHTGQNLRERCNSNGIVCESVRQKCRDYEIRVFCLCPTPAPEVVTPPCTHGWTPWIDTDDPTSGEGDFEQIEEIRAKHELCPTELITDVECQARSYSVGVKNIGSKTISGKTGGYGKGSSKTASGKGSSGSSSSRFSNWLDYTETGDIGVKCSKYAGLACYNNLQSKNRKCRDYRVRFFCNCGATTYKPMPTLRTTKAFTEETIPMLPPTTPKPTTVPSDLCGWTTWLNSDRPSDPSHGNGDFETIERLQEVYGVCAKGDIRNVECRLSDSSRTPWSVAGQPGTTCDKEHGLRCDNSQHTSGCYDYEIRVLCMPDTCERVTTVHPTEVSTVITTPPCLPGSTWSECAYRCDSMCQSFYQLAVQSQLCGPGNNATCIPGCISEECVKPKVWRDEDTCVTTEQCTCITENGQQLPPGDVLEVSDCEKCQCIANSLNCEVTMSCGETTVVNQFTYVPTTNAPFGNDSGQMLPDVPIPIEQSDCWTLWVNVDRPDAGPGDPGDVEDLAAIIPHYSFCSSPMQIECRVANTMQSAAETGQKIVCDPKIGLLCWNEMNPATHGCFDYEVRFYCPCAASTTPAEPTTVVDYVEGFGYGSVDGECHHGFTEWMSAHTPDAAGEYENVQDARKVGHHFCVSERLTAIECRVKDGSGTSYDRSSDRGVTCDLLSGLLCRGGEQADGRLCADYEVRYFCNCQGNASGVWEPTIATTIATTPVQTETNPPETTTTTTVVTTNVACSYWSEWINEGKPWLGIGDIEILHQPTNFCKEGQIEAIECLEADNNVPHTETKARGLLCSTTAGFRCLNKKQPGRMCKDFKIRYFCGCESKTVFTETTTLATTTTTESITTTQTSRTTINIIPPPPSPEIVCNPLDYIYVIRRDDKELPDSRLKASSSLNSLSGPQTSRLDAPRSPYSDSETEPPIRLHNPASYSDKKGARYKRNASFADGGWIPLVKDGEQYIQADLIQPEVLFGIASQGHAILQTWVTSYQVLYSLDGDSFSYVTDSKDHSPKTFSGNYDHGNVAMNVFDQPIQARYVRVVPKTWHNDIAFRFDLIGCSEHTTTVHQMETTTQAIKCNEPMGLENRKLSDRQITASSSYDEHQSSNKARLNQNSSWASKTSDKYQFLQFDFMEPRVIEGLSTQGHHSAPQWVTSYIVSYSTDGLVWNNVLLSETHNTKRVFSANYDENTVVTNFFEKPIRTQFLRIIPQSHHNWIAMRTEILGCYEPYPIPDDVVRPSEIPSKDCREHMNSNLTSEHIQVSSALAGDRSGAARLALDTQEHEDTGGWVAGAANRKQFVVIDYGREVELTGIITQGRNKHNEWVISYGIQYSTDQKNWRTVSDERGNPTFSGNSDSNTKVDHYFNSAVFARFLKIVPQKWHNWISMRLEILGCPHQEGNDSAGQTTTPLPVTTEAAGCYSYGPWISQHTPSPGSPEDHEPIEELISKTQMCANPAKIECREQLTQLPHDSPGVGQRVGCDLTRGLVCAESDQPYGHVCYNYEARIACWTCATDIPTTSLPAVVLCPEVPDSSVTTCPSHCGHGQLCDGHNCVNPVDCPCVQDGKAFKPGTLQQTEKCEECSCKLKGHSYCKNMTCPLCSYGQAGVMDDQCRCSCKTCASGELLCPTNLVCLEERLWCDGVTDCPDDEKDCPTAIPTTTTTTAAPTPCPPQVLPECSGDTMLILSNAAETCPSYECVAIPTLKPTPPPVEKFYCEMSNNYFKTFDGFGYQYDICQHIMLQDKIEQKYNVSVHKNCSDDHGGCKRFLQVLQDDHKLIVDTDQRVDLNGMVYSDSQLVRLARTHTDLTARIIGDTVIIKSPKYGFDINWNTAGNSRFTVTSESVFHINGLCGYFSNDPDDDMQTPDGTRASGVTAFGDSWSVGEPEACSPSTCPPDVAARAVAACDELRLSPFDSCNAVVDPAHYIQVCVASICECMTQGNGTSEKDCRCKAYLPYVEACEMKSIAKIRYWRVKQSCLPNCPPGLVWHDCGSACERTCDSLQEFHGGETEQECESEHCIAGCFCPVGLVRKGDHCVQPEKCQDCVCKGYGDPHYFTYDGLYYAFQGNCTYVLSQDIVSKGSKHKFQVFATNEDCHEEPMTTCTVAVMLLFNDHMAHFRINESVTFDGVQLYQTDYPFHAYGIHIESIPGRSVSFSVPEIFLEVRYFELNYGFEVRIPSEVYYNKTEGLCGNCNFEKGDDLCTKDGQYTNDTNDFGFSWLAEPPEGFESINEICKLRAAAQGAGEDVCAAAVLEQQLCDKLRGDEFLPCHALVSPDDYLQACRFDVCHSTNARASLCRSLTEYARKCAEFGICIQNWRTSELCHYQCPEGMAYDQCGPKCPKSCNDVVANGWELTTRNTAFGRDIIGQETFSLQLVMQELEDVCDSTPVDGCFCQGGRVLKDNVCVDPILCETCDVENHKVGDSWKPNACTACHCTFKLSVECTKTECSPKPTCTTEESLKIISHANNETCCDRWECVLKQSGEAICPQADLPSCNPGEIMKIQHNTTDNCPKYLCECDINECPSIKVPTHLNVGEISVMGQKGCCPTLEIMCFEDACPAHPVCAPDHVLKEHDDGKIKCCKEYLCEPPPNICLYAHEYEVVDGQQLQLKPESFINKIYQAGDVWNDGLCKRCNCESGQGQYKHRCTLEICPTLDDHQDKDDYTWRIERKAHVCCPKFIREQCVVNGKNLTINEEWDSLDGDRCKKYRCGQLANGETIKIERTITCMKDCSLGLSYIEPSSSSPDCCGRCEPVGCVEDGHVYQVGDKWNSTSQKCYKAECRRVDEVIQTHFVGKLCPQISVNCSKRIWDESGCCEICNETTASGNLHVCRPERVKPENTIGLFELFQDQARCTNKLPIDNMMECIGFCESSSTYSSGYGDFISVCHCCSPSETEKVTTQLDCTDGKKRPVEYTQPKSCDCTLCKAGAEGGANSRKPISFPTTNTQRSMRLIKTIYK